jgi:DNA uptake protein ComE-like DNA-binding protein
MQYRSRGEAKAVEVKGYTTRGTNWEWLQSWHLVFFLTLYLYWASLLYMGLRALQFRWVVYALFYAAPAGLYALLHWGMPGLIQPREAQLSLETYLFRAMLAFMVFCFIHVMLARKEFLLRLDDDAVEMDDLHGRMAERRAMRGAPEAGPVPASSGFGRGARAVEQPPGRLLDLNTATEAELAMLPGMGPERARQAMQLRAMQGGFNSYSQFADQLQVPAEARARLQQHFDDRPDDSAPPTDPAFRVLADGRRVLELNWASLEALAALPGLGPDTARRALALRNDNGPFKSLEDFRYRVGLKTEVIIRIEPYVSVISMSTTPGGGAVKTGGRIVDV